VRGLSLRGLALRVLLLPGFALRVLALGVLLLPGLALRVLALGVLLLRGLRFFALADLAASGSGSRPSDLAMVALGRKANPLRGWDSGSSQEKRPGSVLVTVGLPPPKFLRPAPWAGRSVFRLGELDPSLLKKAHNAFHMHAASHIQKLILQVFPLSPCSFRLTVAHSQ
jgi:hypothetical protein